MNKKNRKVPIKNILYMYSFVWDKVDYNDFTFLDSMDDFDSPNILSTLFLINVRKVLKKGLYREYQEVNEELKGIKGKIDFKSSLNKLSLENAKSFCTFDELNENNLINQIIKTTALKLYKTSDISNENKRKINNTLLYFNKVDLVELDDNIFNINFNRNNSYTKLLIQVCKLINDCTILSEDSGKFKFIDIFDDDKIVQNIYEQFVYNFYKQKLEKEQKIFKVGYQHNLNWSFKNGNRKLLPKMKLDILLSNKDNVIIIYTKYYQKYTELNYDKESFISSHIYQMFSYMSNINVKQQLRGILLYPLPFDMKPINEVYNTSVVSNGIVKKTKIQFTTIDLSGDWRTIEDDLISIICGSI